LLCTFMQPNKIAVTKEREMRGLRLCCAASMLARRHGMAPANGAEPIAAVAAWRRDAAGAARRCGGAWQSPSRMWLGWFQVGAHPLHLPHSHTLDAENPHRITHAHLPLTTPHAAAFEPRNARLLLPRISTGAYKGRGRGNAFLNDLCDADVLVHVVDSSGTTDREGAACAPGEGSDPLTDIAWVREEIHRWVKQRGGQVATSGKAARAAAGAILRVSSLAGTRGAGGLMTACAAHGRLPLHLKSGCGWACAK
jgi:hypothetical protein